MASWAVLLALSGFHCDLGRREISFAPVLAASIESTEFSTYWSAGIAWGIYTQRKDPTSGVWTPQLQVLSGDLTGVTVTACGKSWTL